MAAEINSLTLPLIVIFAGVTVIPALSTRLRIPVIVSEIVFGILIGQSFLDMVPEHDTLRFFSTFGLTYLMFLAGLEIDLTAVRGDLRRTLVLALFSVAVPFGAGVMLADYAGIHPLLMGTVFSTTSLGLVLPLTKELHYDRKFLRLLLGTTIVVDILSIFLLAFSITTIEQSGFRVEFIYSLLAVLTLFLLPWLASRPRVQKRIRAWLFQQGHFQDHVRFSFALVFLLAAISGQLGFHSIIGAFIAGLIISEMTPETSLLEKKLESFGYGFFIPLFFILIGSKVDLPGLFSNLSNVTLVLAVVGVGILSKLVGVGVSARASGLSTRESLALGLFHATPLSLTIAVAEIGRTLGLVDENLFSTFVLLAIVSAIASPLAGKVVLLGGRARKTVNPSTEGLATQTR